MYMNKLVVGLTGEIGCGKSYIANKFTEITLKNNLLFTHIDLDVVGHNVLSSNIQVRESIQNEFGTTERKQLGKLIFDDPIKLARLNSIIHRPILEETQRIIKESDGLIIINGALIIEAHYFETVCNGRIIMILTPPDKQIYNLTSRGYSIENCLQRVSSQLSSTRKILEVMRMLELNPNGCIDYIHNYRGDETIQIKSLLEKYYALVFGEKKDII